MKNILPMERLHPILLLLYFPTVLLFTVFSQNPLMPLLTWLSGFVYLLIISAVRGKSVVREFFSSILTCIVFVLVSAAVNPIFSHNGDTILFFVNDTAVTLEAVLYGGYIGLTVSAAITWCRCLSETVSSEAVIHVFGRTSPRIALLLSMTLRFIPLMKSRFSKIRRAQLASGAYNEATFVGRISCNLHCFSMLVTWALEHGVSMGDSMRARGYGREGRTSFTLYRFTVTDGIFSAVYIVAFASCTAFMLLGGGDFGFFPTTGSPVSGIPSIGMIISFGAACAFPIIYTAIDAIVWNLAVKRGVRSHTVTERRSN